MNAASEFLIAVTGHISELGFESAGGCSRSRYNYKWRRRVPWLSTFFEYLEINPIIDRSDLVRISAEIGVESDTLTHVENEYELWTCGAGIVDPASLPWKQPMPLFSVPLQWLTKNAGLEKGTWVAYSATSPNEADEFGQAFTDVGVSVLSKIYDVDGLVSFLFQLDDFPKLTKSYGFYSPDSLNYLAIAMHEAGQTARALEMLESARCGILPSDVQRAVDEDPNYFEIVKCRIAKVTQYLQQSG